MRLFAIAAIFLSTTMLSPAETRFESGPRQTSLIELYTSEGCSSCPPAEAWMSRLKADAGLWKNFVPIAFHVDYWDRLGWRDRFSSPQWTQRQSRYAIIWRGDSVYTPAVAINGQEKRNWSGMRVFEPDDSQPGLLKAVTSDGKTFEVEFQPGKPSAAGYDAHLALLASGISSKVGAGENSGRNLEHDFVVLDLQDAPLKSDAAGGRTRLTITKPAEPGARKAVAIWVTERGQLIPLQATGGWMP